MSPGPATFRQSDVAAGGPVARVEVDSDWEPVPLADACRMFPRIRLTPSTLRAEAARGRIDIFRIGRRDYVTLASIQDMVSKCHDEDRRRAFTSMMANGASETAHIASGLVALSQTAMELKSGSPNSSDKSMNQRRDRTH